MSQQDYNIRVVCRLRPLNKIEIAHGGECCVKYTDKTVQIAVGGDQNKYEFAFDRIFGIDTRQVSIYEEVAKPIINAVVSGFNGTVFAYGQTGGGKTWTMEGPNHDDVQLKGLIPRMMEGLFEKVQSFDPTYQFTIKCSYIQIYNQKIFDLLDPSKNKLEVKEDKQRGIFIQDCTEVYVASVNQMRNTMKNGSQNRKIAFTGMNERSSRSHSLFIVQVGQKDTKKGSCKNAKLYFVDLAGSEKVSKTGVSGQQLEEAKNINKSLSCLGNVINALTSEKKEHVPYRDSKLTRILQQSLGGNSKTTLIINCSICSYNDKETLGTLRFGYRAKSIKNKPTVNEQKSAKQLQILLDKANKTIFDLTEQLKLGNNSKYQMILPKPIPLANQERQVLEKKIQELQNELQSKTESSANISVVNDLQTRIKQLLLQNKMQADLNQQQLEVVIQENKKYLDTIQIFFIRESNLQKLLKRLKTDLNFLLLNLKYDDNRKQLSNKDLQQKTFTIIQIIIKDIEDYLEHIRITHEKYLQQPKTDSNNQNSVQLSTEIINKFKNKIEITMSEPNLHQEKFQKNFEEISCIIKQRLNEDSLSDQIKGQEEESSTQFETLIDSISKEGEQKISKINLIREQKFTIEELKKEIKTLNMTIEELNNKNESLMDQFKRKQGKLQQMYMKRLQEAALQIQTVVNKNKANKQEIKKLEAEKANANKIEAQHNALIEKYKKIVENNTDLAERMKLEQKSKQYANQRQKLFNQLYQLRDQLDEVEITLKEKDELIQSLKTTMKETYENIAIQKPIHMSPQVVQKEYQTNFLGIENKNIVKTIKGGKNSNPTVIMSPPPASQEIKKSVLRSKLLGQETKQGKGLMQLVKNFFS